MLLRDRRIFITHVFVFFTVFALTAVVIAQEQKVLFREEFENLDNWKPFTFPRVQKHSVYAIEKENDNRYLKAESDASASAIVYKDSFSVVGYPRVRWRWKVSNIYENADPRTRTGDDYPVRIYVMFEYDPEKASFGDRILYGLAKARFGAYPPHSSLSYVWASTVEKERIISSPYTDRAKMIFLRMGAQNAGAWLEESVDLIEDYRKAFGTGPPARARIAVMNDSDNTGESSVSWVDYIEVLK